MRFLKKNGLGSWSIDKRCFDDENHKNYNINKLYTPAQVLNLMAIVFVSSNSEKHFAKIINFNIRLEI